MTAYFDSKGKQLHDVHQAFIAGKLSIGEFTTQVETIDRDVVWDVSLASALPGFPVHLRTRVHETVLRHSSAGLPVNAKDPCYETTDDFARGIEHLISDLHTVFHDVFRANVPRFTDDPRSSLRALYADAELVREEMIETRGIDGRLPPAPNTYP